MGTLTDYLQNQIIEQVDKHGIVVWYDSETHYTAIASHLDIPTVTVARYNGSFFALRHSIDPLMGDVNPPRLVVYIPFAQTTIQNALIELEVAGVVMQPGQQPPQRNTKLSVLARNALKPVVGDETIETLVKQVEAGQLTLADLDSWSSDGGISKGVVSVIFKTGNPQEVALMFLSQDRHDTELAKRDALPEFAQLLQNTFEVELPKGEPAHALRTRLTRHILTIDLLHALQGEIPTQLSSIKQATKTAARDACVTLAETWRLRRDLSESYGIQSSVVEKELGLSRITFQLDQIVNVETFLAIETALQHCVEAALFKAPAPDLVAIALAHQSCFWAEQLPDIQAHWALIAATGQLLLEADQIEQALKLNPAKTTPAKIFTAYTQIEQPWCLLDTHHRHMERRWHDFDSSQHDHDNSLEQLVNRARDRYMEVGGKLAEAFVRSFQAAKFQIPGVLHQTEVFERQVKPALANGKTAYIWVDALRYEMARELTHILKADYDVQIQPAIATVPTITEIGMAALLPNGQTGVEVVSVGVSKLGLKVNSTVLKNRSERIKFLQANADCPVFEAKLDELLPKPKKKVRDGIQNAGLILITSQKIDAIGEGDNIRFARLTMDSILQELKCGFQILSDLGVRTIVFAADHGYLFGEELRDDMKIAAPGGQTADLHRRVWVGQGGTADSNYLRANLSEFGLSNRPLAKVSQPSPVFVRRSS